MKRAANSKVQSEMQLLINILKGVDETKQTVTSIHQVGAATKKASAETDNLTRKTEKLKHESSRTAKELQRLGSSVQMGLGLGAGLVATQGALQLLNVMKGAVSMGIQWNSTIEQAEISLTTLLGTTEKAKARMDEIIQEAVTTPFELSQLLEVDKFMQNATEGAFAGSQAIRLIGDTAAATSRPIQEVAMWVGRLYAGLKSGTPVGEATLRLLEMNVVSGELKRELDSLARSSHSSSEVVDVLTRAFGKNKGAMELQSLTLKGLMSSLRDTMGMIAGDKFEGLFDGLKNSIRGVLELLDALPTNMESFYKTVDSRVDALISKINSATRSSVNETSADLASTITEFQKQLAEQQKTVDNNNPRAAGRTKASRAGTSVSTPEYEEAQGKVEALTRALNELQLQQARMGETSALGGLRTESELLWVIEEANQKLEERDNRGRLMLRANSERASELRDSILAAQRELEVIRSRGEAVAEETLIQNELMAAKQRAADIASEYAGVEIDRRSELEKVSARILEIEQKRDELLGNAHLTEQDRNRISFKFEKDLQGLLKERAEIEAGIAKTRMEAIREMVDAQLNELEADRLDLTSQRRMLEADWTQTKAARHGELMMHYAAELAAIEAVIVALEQARDATDDPAAKALYSEQIRNLQDDKLDTQVKLETADPNSFADQGIEAMVALQEQWGTLEEMFAKGVSSSLQGAVDGLAGAIEGMINRTMTWGQALRNIWVGFVGSMVQAFSKMVAEYAMSKAAQFAIDKLFAKKATVLTLPAAAAAMGQWSAAALMASIATYGSAVPVGTAAWGASMATATGMLTASTATGAGLREGGYTGNGPRDEFANYVHGQEYVTRAAVVAQPGAREFLDDFNSDGMAALERYHAQSGGSDYDRLSSRVAGNVTASANQTMAGALSQGSGTIGQAERVTNLNLALVDSRKKAERSLRGREGERIIVDIAKRRFLT